MSTLFTKDKFPRINTVFWAPIYGAGGRRYLKMKSEPHFVESVEEARPTSLSTT